MKSFYKTLLAVYLLMLIWLILFKTSIDFTSVLAEYQSRRLNLIPFDGASRSTVREMIDNLVVFIPLGLLLGVNLKHINLRRKLAFAFGLSLAAEILQYVLAIGTSDITDVIMNTLGGFVGLAVYGLGKKYIGEEKLDRFIVMTVMVLLALLIWLRFFVLRVRY
jgi:glycopeptide antibiotics resistance protein